MLRRQRGGCARARRLRSAGGALGVAASLMLAWGPAAAQDPLAGFRRSINGTVESALFLGFDISQEEAEAAIRANPALGLNPLTGSPYDLVVAFAAEAGVLGGVVEVFRVVQDNLGWSVLTDYEKTAGLCVDTVVAYSNGCDVAANAIRAGLIHARHLVAISPPCGFKDEALTLPVRDVKIYYTRTDGVAKALGKGLLLGALQSLARSLGLGEWDIDIGVTKSPRGEPLIGGRATMYFDSRPLDGKPTDVREQVMEPTYFGGESAWAAHDLWANLNRMAAIWIADLERALRSTGEEGPSASERLGMEERLDILCRTYPDAARHVHGASEIPVYFTSSDANEPESKRITEADILADMSRSARRVVVVGEGAGAERLYEREAGGVGEDNVLRVHDDPGAEELQLIARRFGAEVILGSHDPRRRSRVEAGRTRGSSGPEAPEGPNSDDPPYRGGPPDEGLPPCPPFCPCPPYCDGSGGTGSTANTVGGVLLEGASRMLGADGFSGPGSVPFSLLVREAAPADDAALRRFLTALWAVYFSQTGPGISIDPIAPGFDKHSVRYIGSVLNSDLARVMREADYLMKQWAVGSSAPDIEGFRSVDALSAEHGIDRLGAGRRFWFVPDAVRTRSSADALLVDGGSMRVLTEYMSAGAGGRAEPADERFVQFFTEHYADIAARYPVYAELLEYARLVGLAQAMRDRGAPMLWYLMANKDLILTEDSPLLVDAIAKDSEYRDWIRIEGGVDLSSVFVGATVFDDSRLTLAVAASRDAAASRGDWEPSRPIESLDLGDAQWHVQDISVRADAEWGAVGSSWQTDIALRSGSLQGIELVRHYDPQSEELPAFGRGWHLMIPYALDSWGAARVEFLGVTAPRRMRVRNLLTNDSDTLTFDEDQFDAAAWVPTSSDSSALTALFLMSDGSFTLVDKMRNEFAFTPGGDMTRMLLGEGYVMDFEYELVRTSPPNGMERAPRVLPAGGAWEEVGPLLLPRTLEISAGCTAGGSRFRLNAGENQGFIAYESEDAGDTRRILLRNDGGFVLVDGSRCERHFDSAGQYEGTYTKVVSRISTGEHHVTFTYGEGVGTPCVTTATLSGQGVGEPGRTIRYSYEDGQLAAVRDSAGHGVRLLYRENEVMEAPL